MQKLSLTRLGKDSIKKTAKVEEFLGYLMAVEATTLIVVILR
jgi:hypothetical protein